MTADDARAKRRRPRSKIQHLPEQREMPWHGEVASNPEAVPSASAPPAAMPETVAVSVPSDTVAYLKRLIDAAQPGLHQKRLVELRFHQVGTPLAWRRNGCDLEHDIVPAIKAVSARAPPGSILSWDYFTKAIFAERDRRLSPAPTPEARQNQTGGFVERGKPPKRTLVDALFDERSRVG